MDVSELAEELRSDDPDLPPAEAAFVEAVEAARAALDAGELTSEEYHQRVASASDRYRRAANADG
jgi:hypothetical protein